MTGRERLLVLRDALRDQQLLETAHVERFDINHWFVPVNQTILFMPGVETLPEPMCGVAACAAGIGCTLPQLRAEGLTLVRVGHHFGPAYAGEGGYMALSTFFELRYGDILFIFSPTEYGFGCVSPELVAQRIDKVLQRPDTKRAEQIEQVQPDVICTASP